jgi:hypothetical protein
VQLDGLGHLSLSDDIRRGTPNPPPGSSLSAKSARV